MKYQPLTLIALIAIGLFSCTAPALRQQDSMDETEQDPVARTPEAVPVSATEVRERGKTVADAVGGVRYHLQGRNTPNFNTESYDHIVENVFLSVAANPCRPSRSMSTVHRTAMCGGSSATGSGRRSTPCASRS